MPSPATQLLPELLPLGSADVHRSANGTMFLWQPAPSVVVTRAEGYFASQAARAVEVAWRRAASAGRLVSFNDWEEMTDYDSATRVHLTGVGFDLRSRFDMCHVLARSRTVLMGVQMASLAVRSVKAHTSRAEFERLLRVALR